ncbi:hypothetical protein FSP39_005194 [Pinctada imbricata]|uniref:Novel STAND NTPase 3 domain-containing protein n=1 Tax=Pinctada imbricata TaxID=66713 RepID=A0AA89C3M6_PINIB|nr:hypothetical protein FSP39_005194 [Pinctada imbricata]
MYKICFFFVERGKRLLEKAERSQRTFVKTKAYKHILRRLKNVNVITITGAFGSGKKTLASQLAFHYSSQKFLIIPIYDCQEISQCFDPGENQVFIINDPFGTSNLDTDALARWTKYHDDICDLVNNSVHSKMIFTCRLQVFKKEISTSSSFRILYKNAIDISYGRCKLTYRDRQSLLRRYGLFLHMPILSENFNNPAFPYFCNAAKEGKEIECNPPSIYSKEIRQLLMNDDYSFTLYLILATNNRFVRGKEDLNDIVGKYTGIIDTLRFPVRPFYNLKVEDCLDELEGSFLKETGGVYSFINETVYDILAYNAGLLSKKFAIQTCSRDFFINKLTFNSKTTKSSNLTLSLTKNDFESWFERLTFEIKRGQFLDIVFGTHFSDKVTQSLLGEKVRMLPPYELLDILKQKENQVRLMENIPEHSVYILREFPLYRGLNFLCAVLLGRHLELFGIIWNVLKMSKHYTFFDKDDLLRVAVMVGDKDSLTQIVKTVWKRTFLPILKTPMSEKMYMSFLNSFPMCISSACGHLDLVTYFHEVGFDINERYINGDRPLSYAAWLGCKKVVKYLISRNANINVQNKKGKTPLMLAVDHFQIARTLLLNGANIHLCDMNGENALMMSSGLGKMNVAYSILHFCETSDITTMVNIQKINGFTALHKACECEDKTTRNEIAKMLLQTNANPMTFDAKQRSSPLHLASAQNDRDLANSLILYGTDVNCTDIVNVTPLFIAAENGFSEMVKCLLSHGANPKIPRKTDNASPLLISAERGRLDVVKILLNWVNHEEDVNSVNHQNCTPLLMATLNNHTKVCEVLLENNADINISNHKGYHPIHVASRNGNAKLVNRLIQNRANIDPKTLEDENTPLHLAAMMGHKSVAKILLVGGADIESQNNEGLTPFVIANYMKQKDTEDLLHEFRMFGLGSFEFQTKTIESPQSLSLSLSSEVSLNQKASNSSDQHDASESSSSSISSQRKVPSRRSIADSSSHSVYYSDKGSKSIKDSHSLNETIENRAIIPLFRHKGVD